MSAIAQVARGIEHSVYANARWVVSRCVLVVALLLGMLGMASIAPTEVRAQGCGDYDPCPNYPAPSVAITVFQSSVNQQSVQLEITINGSWRLDTSTWSVSYNGSQLTTWMANHELEDHSNGFEMSMSASGEYTLSAGTFNLIAYICDEAPPTPKCGADTVAVTYTAPPQLPTTAAPTIALAQPDRIQSIDGCATCASQTATYTTPTFVVNGAAESVTLRYSSEFSGKAFLAFDVLVASSTTPSRLSLEIRKNGTAVTQSHGGTQSFVKGSTAPVKLAAEFDADPNDSLAAIVRAYYGPVNSPSAITVDTLENLRGLSYTAPTQSYGKGWSVSGLSWIESAASPVWEVRLHDGLGGVTHFKKTSCNGATPNRCTFAPPAGVFDTLFHVDSTTADYYFATSRTGLRSEWDADGRWRLSRDRWGNERRAVYRAAHGVIDTITIATAVGGTAITKRIVFGYTGSSSLRLSTITLPDGRQSLITITDTLGVARLDSIRDPDGKRAAKYAYDASWRLIRMIGRTSDTAHVQYDSLGQVLRIRSSAIAVTGGTASDTIHVSSLKLKLLDSLMDAVTDSARVALSAELAFLQVQTAGVTTKIWGAASGGPAKVVTTDGADVDSTMTTYNAAHQVVATAGSATAGEEYEWTGPLLTRARDLGTGKMTVYHYVAEYDQLEFVEEGSVIFGRHYYSGYKLAPDSTKTDSANVVRYTYDSRGRVVTVTSPHNATETTTYETTHGNPSSVARTASGVTTSTTSYTYDASGRMLTTTDPAGEVFTTRFDVLGRDSVHVGPIADSTKFTHNDATRAYSVTDAIGQTYTTELNLRGWPTRVVDPAGNADSTWYDRLGRVTKTRARNGGIVEFTYDTQGRVAKRKHSRSSGAMDSTMFGYDAAGEWTSVANAESVDTFFVDNAQRLGYVKSVRSGKVLRLWRTYVTPTRIGGLVIARDSGATNIWTDSLGLAYDPYHKVKQLRDFAQKVTQSRTDKAGRPLVDTLPTHATPSSRVRKSMTHSLIDLRTNDSYSGNAAGLNRNYSSYNTRDLLTMVIRPPASGAGIIRDYVYDDRARVTSFRDRQSQIVDYQIVYGDTIWDPWGDCPSCFIVPEEQIPIWGDVTLDSAGYSYDKVGNRTDNSASISSGNRMTGMHGWTITYDASGNITQRRKGADTLRYAWNSLGQLDSLRSSASPGYTVTYGYDGLGRRVRKTVNGTVTRYLLDGDRVIADLDANWAAAAKYSYYPGTDRPHAMERGGSIYYYTQDAQGNVTGLIDGSGNVANTYNYGAYGERRTGSGSVVNPYQFKGREWDAEAQLYFMRARYYDPLIGRFISEDPIGTGGGINPTVFAAADPVNHADPSGLLCVKFSNGVVVCETVTITEKELPGADRPAPDDEDNGNAGWNPKGCDSGGVASIMASGSTMASSCGGSGTGTQSPQTDPCATNPASSACKAKQAQEEADAARLKDLRCEAATANQWNAVFSDATATIGLGAALKAMKAQRLASMAARRGNRAARIARNTLQEHGPLSSGGTLFAAGVVADAYLRDDWWEVVPGVNILSRTIKLAASCL